MGCILSKEDYEEDYEEDKSLSSQSISPCSLLPLVKTKEQKRIQNIQTIFSNEYNRKK